MKNSNDTIGNRTRDPLACSTVLLAEKPAEMLVSYVKFENSDMSVSREKYRL